MEFLYLVVVFAPFVAPWVALCAATVLVRRAWGGGRRRFGAASYALVALVAGSVALGAYGWGVMSGFYVLDPDQTCAAEGVPGDHIVTRTTLPVSARCVTSDGVGSELVPVWVNPVIYAGLAAAVAAVGAGAFTAVRGRQPGRREVDVRPGAPGGNA